MTMGDELPVTSLVLPVLIRPVLTQVSHFEFVCPFYKTVNIN